LYNNCFLLTGTAKDVKSGKKIKKAMYVNKEGKIKTLFKWDPKNDRIIEENLQYYQMPYWRAKEMYDFYIANGWKCADEEIHDGIHTHGDNSLRISVWLEDAMWNDLHLLCIDFDKINGIVNETPFFSTCIEAADFVTRSQGGGYHCWFGVNKEIAAPLFEEINLTTHKHTKSFVCAISLTSNGEDKFDVFCCNGRLVHEYEPWQPNRGVTDKTQTIYKLFKQYVEIKKKPDVDFWEDAEGKHIVLEGMPEDVMREQMTKQQQEVLDDLKLKDAGCTREQWFWVGCNIKEVFGEELGGSVWLWWSRQGENYQRQACVNTWGEINRRKTQLRDYNWDRIMESNILAQKEQELKEIAKKVQRNEQRVKDNLILKEISSLQIKNSAELIRRFL
jgi:hypothetical protein